MGSGAIGGTNHADGGEEYVKERVRDVGELGTDVAGVDGGEEDTLAFDERRDDAGDELVREARVGDDIGDGISTVAACRAFEGSVILLQNNGFGNSSISIWNDPSGKGSSGLSYRSLRGSGGVRHSPV